MESEGLVLDDRSTTGEVQFLGVKISSLRSWECAIVNQKQHIKTQTHENTKNTKRHEKTQKTRKNRETRQKSQ